MYRGIEVRGWDVMLCHSYEDFHLDVAPLRKYRTIYLYAWSLGVYAAEQSLVHLQDLHLSRAVAVNGTSQPVDDIHGIPTAIFSGTADGLTMPNLLKFGRRMFASSQDFLRFKHLFEYQNIESLRRQLYFIRDHSSRNAARPRLPWTEVIVGNADHIFPPANQERAWQGFNVTLTDSAHYVDLPELINASVVNVERVGKIFARNAVTYEANAIVQRHMAETLAGMLAPYRADKVAEIGYGSGLFSRMYAPILKPQEIEYVDICPVPSRKLALAEIENYVSEDAEKWIVELKQSCKFDAIVSSAAVQWFADPVAFIRRCMQHLAPGGLLAFSTFGQENMWQLNAVRRSPLQYLSLQQWRSIPGSNMHIVNVSEDTVDIYFHSLMEMLRHLKATGVTGGTNSSPALVRRLLSELPPEPDGRFKLTYNPLYFVVKL